MNTDPIVMILTEVLTTVSVIQDYIDINKKKNKSASVVMLIRSRQASSNRSHMRNNNSSSNRSVNRSSSSYGNSSGSNSTNRNRTE